MALTLDLSISTQTAYSSGSSGLVPLRATASPYAGSPVGALPGMVGNLVMDSTTGHLWACTSSGSSGSTVWEPVIVDSQLTDGSLSPTFKALAVTGADTVLTPTNSPSSSGGITLTAAMLDNGVVVRSGPTAAFTDTLDTAANIITYLDATAGTGQGFRFVYVNTTAFVATIAAGTGITIVGPATVDGNSVREFVVVQTGASAFSFYALGQGSSGPAVTNGGLTQLGQFPYDFSSAGYAKLPNGWILQWTASTSCPIPGTTAVTWPVAFPNAILGGWANSIDGGTTVNYRTNLASLTTTGADIIMAYGSATGSVPAQAFAIGY